MARRSSIKSLKDEKPYFYCIAHNFGSIKDLAQTGLQLKYIVDPRDISDVWRYLGNPKFRNDYSYLLIAETPDGCELNDVYAVKVTKPEIEGDATKTRRSRKTNLLMGHFNAFEGEVDRICFGWTTKAHAKRIMETGRCCTGDLPRKSSEIL